MRAIDADLMGKQIFAAMNRPDATNEDKITYAVIMTWVDLQPTVDAVEVVRCQNCRHWERIQQDKPYGCCTLYDMSGGVFATGEDDYCSKGERREE